MVPCYSFAFSIVARYNRLNNIGAKRKSKYAKLNPLKLRRRAGKYSKNFWEKFTQITMGGKNHRSSLASEG